MFLHLNLLKITVKAKVTASLGINQLKNKERITRSVVSGYEVTLSNPGTVSDLLIQTFPALFS